MILNDTLTVTKTLTATGPVDLSGATVELDSDQIANESVIPGSTVTEALDAVNQTAGTAETFAKAFYLNAYYPELNGTDPVYVVSPVTGTITWISVVARTNPGATNVVAASIGGTPITNGSVSIGASEGGVAKSANPTADNVVIAGNVIRLLSDGGASANTPAWVMIGITAV